MSIAETKLSRTSTKSQQVACALEKEILASKLKVGSRLAGMRDIAEHFSVSLKVVQCAVKILESKGLVKSQIGSGTFVSCNGVKNSFLKNTPHPDTIYVLMHSPENIIPNKYRFSVENRIIYGGYSSGAEYLIQPLPVSRKKQRKLTDIAWDILSHIPDGSKVFISSLWFKAIFPFLHEKQADVICLANQYEQINFPETFKFIKNSGWNIFVLDYITGISNAVKYLYYQKNKRIGLIKLSQNQPLHPFRQGMIAAFEECGLKYEDELYHEMSFTAAMQMKHEIISFCKKQKPDSLIIANGRYHKFNHKVITASLSQLNPITPILFMPEAEIVNCPARDFSWVDIGKTAALSFKNRNLVTGSKLLKPEFINRNLS